jgi:hypothetical protein
MGKKERDRVGWRRRVAGREDSMLLLLLFTRKRRRWRRSVILLSFRISPIVCILGGCLDTHYSRSWKKESEGWVYEGE